MRDRWLLLLAGTYLLALALIGMWSSPVDQNIAVSQWEPAIWFGSLVGLDMWQMYDLIEKSANVALFVPLGALVLLWRPRWGLLQAVAVSFATSALIETCQQLLRPERFASVSDLVANTLGGTIGALLVLGSRLLIRRSGRALRSDRPS